MKIELEFPGIGIVKIKRGRNIRMLSLKMAPGRGIWMNVPYGVSDKKAEDFLFSQREWILANREKIKQSEHKAGLAFGPGSEIATKYHVLKIVLTGDAQPSYKLDGKEVRLCIPDRISEERIAPLVKNFLTEIYRWEARMYLPGRIRELARQYGFVYGGLSLRNNRSNWGSCSHENNISLNIKLMKLPDDVIDYVILHELCHTVEKNHSDQFWKEVEKVCPAYRNLRQQLKMYTTGIE